MFFLSIVVFIIKEFYRWLRYALYLLRLTLGKAFSKGPTDSEKLFVQQNAAFWNQLGSLRQDVAGGGYVLVEPQFNPVIVLCNAAFAAIVSQARNLKSLFVVNSARDGYTRILASYPSSQFVYTYSWRYLIPRILASYYAIKAAKTLKSPGDILKFKIDNIRFGDVIYDSVLAMGYVTLRKVDEKVLTVLSWFFFYRHLIKDMMRRYNIVAYVGHSIGVSSATFSRYLLQDGIEVLNRTGSHEIQVKKWQSMADVGLYFLKPEERYFSFMMKGFKDNIERAVDEYLDARFNQKVEGFAENLAFNPQKRTFSSKEEFCQHYQLDVKKKLVFVMLHEFTDFPHTHFAKPMIFRDFYDWFEKTLEIAKSTDSVNWIFKEHPTADFYPTKDVNFKAVFKGMQYPQIRFLSCRADFNARSLHFIADVIVTCMGTAGLECACLGIPCVLAAESPYSGFGFTTEPEDAVAYESQLRQIHQLKPLNISQIKAAKTLIYFLYAMMLGGRFLFCPQYSQKQIRSISAAELWRDAAELMKNGNKTKMIKQVNALSDFVRERSYTQYIDLEKYDFMRPAFNSERG